MRNSRAALAAALLSLGGLAVSVWLGVLHLGLLRGEFLGGVACGGGLDCHAVIASRWGAWLGLPLAHWGMIAYAATFALSLLAGAAVPPGDAARRLLGWLVLAMLGADAFLAYVMFGVLHGFCPFCVGTYAINLALLGVAWWGLAPPARRAWRSLPSDLCALLPWRAGAAGWLAGALVALVAAGALGLHVASGYLLAGESPDVPADFARWLANQPAAELDLAGDPARGPADAPVQIVIFSDFNCPTCRKTGRMLDLLEASHRGEVRVVFKNFPLDRACNAQIARTSFPGSCELAVAGEAAHAQGKFWAFHDALQQGASTAPDAVLAAAETAGLDLPRFNAERAAGDALARVRRDVDDGARAGVASTPTVLINGVAVRGPLRPQTFAHYLDALREARR